MGVQCVQGADVGNCHQDDGKCFMYHYGCSSVGQATVAGGKVPHTAQQGARCAAYKHQGLRNEDGKKSVGHNSI